MHTHPIVGEYRVLEGGHDNVGFASARHHDKVQDSTLATYALKAHSSPRTIVNRAAAVQGRYRDARALPPQHRREHQRRLQVVVVGEVNSLSDGGPGATSSCGWATGVEPCERSGA